MSVTVTPATPLLPEPAPAPQPGLARGLLKALRPKQWVKSALVPAAPVAAGVLGQSTVFWHTVVAVVTFSLCASGGYLINDAADVEADRRHPKKRNRPIAAGIVPVALARTLGILLVAGSITAGGLLTSWKLAAVLGGYVVLTFSYSTWLKHVPVLEMMLVAAGFLLRPIAGAAATDVKLSQWFLIVASFGSLYMVAGKRTAEATEFGEDASAHRRILQAYPIAYLRQTRELSRRGDPARLLPVGVRAQRAARRGLVEAVDRAGRRSGCCATSCCSSAATAGPPRKPSWAIRHSSLTGLVWILTFVLGVYLEVTDSSGRLLTGWGMTAATHAEVTTPVALDRSRPPSLQRARLAAESSPAGWDVPTATPRRTPAATSSTSPPSTGSTRSPRATPAPASRRRSPSTPGFRSTP